MRIACCQFTPVYRDPDTNVARIDAAVRSVDADLIVLPELCTTGYFFRERSELVGLAEPLVGGQLGTMLQSASDEQNVTMVAGFAERSDEHVYNSALIIRPGREPEVYRKTHLFYYEKDVFTPGNTGFVVFDATDRSGIEYRLGVMICFDWYFPEAARSLALSGADIIAHPSNLVRKDCPRSMPIRALENHVFTVTANRIGSEQNGDELLEFIGQSLICDPSGNVISAAGRDEDAVLTAEIDPRMARDRQITATNDLFGDRRPALYTALH